jgi:hypothetical protein
MQDEHRLSAEMSHRNMSNADTARSQRTAPEKPKGGMSDETADNLGSIASDSRDTAAQALYFAKLEIVLVG